MAVTLDVIKRLTVLAQSKGVDELRGEMERLAATQKATGEATVNVGNKFVNLEKQLFPLIKAQSQLEQAARTAFNSMVEGSSDATRAANVLAAATERYQTVAKQAMTATQAQAEALKQQRIAYEDQGRAVKSATEAQERWNKYARVSDRDSPDGAKRARENAAIAAQMQNRFAEIEEANTRAAKAEMALRANIEAANSRSANKTKADAREEIVLRQRASEEIRKRQEAERGTLYSPIGVLSGKSARESAQVFQKPFDDARARFDPLFKAQREYLSNMREARAEMDKGAISERTYHDYAIRSRQEYSRVRDEEVGGGRLRRLGSKPGERLATHQSANMMYQVNDIVTGVASGQSPFMIMAQQGGQVYQILSDGPGGIGGAAKRLGNFLGDLLTPMRLMTLGMVGFGVAAVAAFNDAQNRAVAMLQAINGIGGAAGLSGRGLNNIAMRAAAGSSTISIAQAQTQAQAYVRTGASADVISGLTGDTTERFSRSFGMTLEDSAKLISDAFKDPAKGAKDLNAVFGTISDATMESIKRLQEAGEAQKAQKLLFDALSNALSLTTPRVTDLGHAAEVAKKFFSDMWSRFGQALMPDRERRLENLQKRRDDIEDLPAKARRSRNNEYQKVLGEIAKIEGEYTAERVKTEKQQAEIRKQQLAAVAGGYIRELFPDEERRKQLIARRSAVLGSDPGATGEGAAKTAEAAARLGNQLRYLLPPLQQMAVDSAINVQQALAMTAAQRAAVDAQKAYLQVMRDTGDTSRASAAAEMARNQAVADGLRQALEANRDSRKSLDLASMLPGDRSIAEIRQQMVDLRRQTEIGSGSQLPQVFVPFKLGLDTGTQALQTFTAALGTAATKVTGGVPGVGSASGVSWAGPAPAAISGGGGLAKGAIADYIRQRAKAEGIDPEIAVRVAQSEGLNTYVGDKGTSFGPFQLHYGGLQPGALGARGLGDTFTARTGLDARDPSTVKQQIDFALAEAKKSGWGAWYGAGNVGIGKWEGIRGNAANSNNPAGMVNPAVTRNVNNGTEANQLRADQERKYTSIVRENIQSIEMQNLALDRQFQTLGMSNPEIARAAEMQRMYNEAQRQGLTITPEYAAGIRNAANAMAELSDRQLTMDRFKEGMGNLQSLTGSFVSTFANGLARGKSGVESLRMGLSNLGSQLINLGSQQIAKSLFGLGGSGSVFGGLLGRAFGLGGGGGGFDTVGVPGGWDAAFADGGVMSSRGSVPLRKYAAGGIADSPQMALFGEGRTPEAYVPLQDGRTIPVSIVHGRKSMESNGPSNVSQSISVNGGSVIVQGNITDDVMPKVQAMMAQNSKEVIRHMQRNLGTMQMQYAKRRG